MEIITIVLLCVVLVLQIILLLRKGVSQSALRDEGDRIRKATAETSAEMLRRISEEQARFRMEQSDAGVKSREELRAGFKEIRETVTADSDRTRAMVEKKLEEIRAGNEAKLEQMRETVNEKLQKTLDERLGESFRTVSDQLKAVHKGLGEMQLLAKDVGGLKNALTNVKTRGIFGEIQLERLLEEVFAPGQFEKNFSVRGTAERVEFAIRLPGKEEGGAVYLPIDSKYPVEDYAKLQSAYEAGDIAAIEAAQKGIESFIKQQAKTISDKYIMPPKTTDFALMFLPYEGLYAEVLRIPGLIEQLQTKYKINVCGPTTLIALLNSLQMGFKTLAIEKRSGEVWKLLSAVKAEFETFGQALAKAQSRIREADKEIDTLVGVRTRAIQRKLRDVEELPAGEEKLFLE